MRTVSLNEMVRRCEGLIGTKHVNDWEDGFLQSVVRRTQSGKDTSTLTGPQVDSLERIHNKHFA